jgi:hypothetical protein
MTRPVGAPNRRRSTARPGFRPLTVVRNYSRTFSEHPSEMLYGDRPRFDPTESQMADHASDYINLTRICEFTRRLHKLHRLGGEDAIDYEFSAVCRAIWGYTLDDFTDEDLSAEDHAWLDDLTRECAIDFAAEQGYDLRDYVHGGCVAGWWGFTWMILAEARGVLTPEKRAAAWCRHE